MREKTFSLFPGISMPNIALGFECSTGNKQMYVSGNFDQTGETMSASPSFPLQSDTTERPISVYDNLNSAPVSSALKDSSRKTNSNGHPFNNISFKFENGIGNGSSRCKAYSSPTENTTSPDKIIIGAPVSNHTTNVKNSQRSIMNANVTKKQLPAILHTSRPPIDHNLTETSSNLQSTVATKPVISDAKSKFFGLNSENPEANINYSAISESNSPLLDDHRGPQMQIIPSDHKYQNIPPNSAIFHKVNEPDAAEKISGGTYTTTSGFPTAEQDTENQPIDEVQNHSNRSTKSFHFDMELTPIQQPSQVIYMSTTVPQNIKGPNIAGRHTPTRNSLRHSRMLVVNKNYQGVNTQNPLDLKYPLLTRILLIFHIIIGLLITFIGIWILLWAPNTRMQDNPYWSGLSLVLSGILGLIVIRFKRIKRQKIREHCFKFLKVDSLMLSIVALILCIIACTCAVNHLLKLLSPNTKCTSTNMLVANAACICTFGSAEQSNIIPSKISSVNSTQEHTGNGHEFQYRDLSCSEVAGAWKYILLASIVLNALGFVLSACYLLLVCFKKTSKRKIYNSVKTNPF